jgi:hypothetical protein
MYRELSIQIRILQVIPGHAFHGLRERDEPPENPMGRHGWTSRIAIDGKGEDDRGG